MTSCKQCGTTEPTTSHDIMEGGREGDRKRVKREEKKGEGVGGVGGGGGRRRRKGDKI